MAFSDASIVRIAADPAGCSRRAWSALVEHRAIIGAMVFCPASTLPVAMLQAGEPRLAIIATAVAAIGAIALFYGHEATPVPDLTHAGEIDALTEEEFNALEDFVEREAASLGNERRPSDDADTPDGDAFEALVRDALDDLPESMQAVLAGNVAVLVRDDGHVRRAYGLYVGTTYAYGGYYGHRIHIYRDTLMRDFGHDPDELRRQVTITVQHELAHHLGANERHVAALGL